MIDAWIIVTDYYLLHVQVSAGCAHSAVVTDQGLALTFGDGRYNQLGKPHVIYYRNIIDTLCDLQSSGHSDTRVYNQPCLVQYLSHIQLLQVSCGSCHTLFVDTAVRLFLQFMNLVLMCVVCEGICV